MSVANIGAVDSGVNQTSLRSTVHQAHDDFLQLLQAMQAGNLAGAQQSYADLAQLPLNATQTTAPASAATSSSASAPIAGDWSALGQALQSGSMSSAQDALSKLEQDLNASVKGSGHHHHHHSIDKAQTVYSAMTPEGASAISNTGTTSVSSDLASLKLALSSGDTTSASDLLAKLEQDLQTSAGGSVHRHHHGAFAAQNAGTAYGGGSSSVSSVSAGVGSGSSTS